MSEEKELQTITAADVGAVPPWRVTHVSMGGAPRTPPELPPPPPSTPPAPPSQAIEPILQYFSYGHLPPPLRTVSAQFAVLAEFIVDHLPRCAERTVALRKLLEGKDAAVRAALGK